jgi:hypothetical protein
MSENEDTKTGEAVNILCQRVRDLTAQIDTVTAKRRRRQRITAVAGVLLAVTSAFGLAGLTSMTKRLDAEAIAQISRQHLEARLPGARMKTQEYLEQEAPRIVRETLRSMLASLPRVRTLLFRGLMSKFDELNYEFEKNTIEIMSHFVHESKQKIDAQFPDLSDREKVEKLVVEVAAQFKKTIEKMTTALYPSYHSEMDRVISYLDTLEHTPAQDLTHEQRIQKEIIETLMQLLDRRQAADRRGR